jgi:hypothetical protein
MNSKDALNINMDRLRDFAGCQIYTVPKLALERVGLSYLPLGGFFKRQFAAPWNLIVKKWLKKKYFSYINSKGETSSQLTAKAFSPSTPFKKGDFVRVRSLSEILSTLDPFKELKGCAFLPEMNQYCETTQLIFKSMEHFIDERDYKLKKTHGIILLENVICSGTPVFGQCDRCCFLFWREEWLEKVE